ncbi:MAG: DUF3791 domain-containing protein [Bacteroidales bacterium]|nr:DUF3791 domain-containing protein [Bacteroidales bacterium]
MKKNIIEYIVVFISEFSRYHKLSLNDGFNYLNRYKALSFLEEQYDIAHTMNFSYMIESMSDYCRRNGGNL